MEHSPSMTTIAVIGASRSMPDDIEGAVPGDEVIRIDRLGQFGGAERVEVAIGTSRAPDLIRDTLRQAPRLRWLHLASAGVDRALIPEVRDRADLVVTNNSGSYEVCVPEFALSLIFAAAKRLHEHHRSQARAYWDRGPQSMDVRGSTLVVLGLGSIGTELARLAAALGMRVIGVRRHPDGAAVPGIGQIVGPDRLQDVAAQADWLAVTAPLTAATRGLVSREVIKRMKPTAWIINVGRGEIVDEPALLEALEGGHIGGAAIDTWWTEPVPADSRWWQLPNVIATPHAASSSPFMRERTLQLFLENLRRWKKNQPLQNVVDPKAGY